MLEHIYLLIPAYIANMAPVLARRLKWDAPMDFGLTLHGERILGSHKTWKGFIIGTGAGTIIGIILAQFFWPFAFSPLIWSLLASAGSLLGDALKSFFKRQLKIKPGKPWIPFDEIDFSIGALALGSIIYFPGWTIAIVLVIISALGHIAVNHIAYWTKIRSEKW